MKLDSPFAFGDKVVIDDDDSIVAKVTAFQFRAEYCTCEISWVYNGEIKTAWIENWRLRPVGVGLGRRM